MRTSPYATFLAVMAAVAAVPLFAAADAETAPPENKSEGKAESATQPFSPPFGLKWGEEAGRLEGLLGGAKATIVRRTKQGAREIWRVEGLVQKGLKATVFEMTEGKLTSVSLHYQREEWSDESYRKFSEEVKRRLIARFGEPIGKGADETAEFTETGEEKGASLQEFAWRRAETGIRLVYSQMGEDPLSRAIKVQYSTALQPTAPARK